MAAQPWEYEYAVNGTVTTWSEPGPTQTQDTCPPQTLANQSSQYANSGPLEEGYQRGLYLFNHESQAFWSLFTGGKSAVGRKNLVALSTSATRVSEVIPLGMGPGSTLTPIPSPQVKLGGLGNLGSDGWLYVALPDNETVDITPFVAGLDYYQWSDIGAQKYRSYFEVFVDEPDPTGNAIWTVDGSAGHAWWKFRTDAPGAALNLLVPSQLVPLLGVPVGYGPTASVTLTSPTCLGTLRDPEPDFYFQVYKRYNIGFPDVVSGLTYTKGLEDSPGTYDLFSFNCVDATVAAKCAAGVFLPNERGDWTFSNPGKLRQGTQ